VGQPLEQRGRAARLDRRMPVDDEVLAQAARVEPQALDRQADAGVALEVGDLARAEQVGRDDLVAVEAGPDAADLWAAVGVQRDHVDERRGLEQLADFGVEHCHRRQA
jgi:hypothetical protein